MKDLPRVSKILVCTVWHTGSNYVRDRLKRQGYNVIFQHCDEQIFSRIDDIDPAKIVTTLRDVLDTAASWANRYNMQDPMYRYYWIMLWAGWERLLSYNPEIWLVEDFKGPKIRSAGDPKRMHEIRNQDLEQFYQFFPKDLVDFAKNIAARGQIKLAMDKLVAESGQERDMDQFYQFFPWDLFDAP